MDITILEAKQLLWKVKDKTIVDVDSFKVLSGEHISLIGPNGSGKSSLVKILAFLQHPTSGEIIFESSRGKSIIDKRREMAIVMQEPLLLNMTVYDNVAYGLKIRKFKGDIKKQVEYWLEKLNIYHLKKRYPKNLSGGEAQRVSIARALALNPKILFLDEPFTALDAPTKAQLLEELNLLIKQSNITSIFITHDFSEIPFLADKVYVMLEGKIVQKGTIEEIFYRPVNEGVANLVGADNQYNVKIIEKLSSSKYVVAEYNTGIKLIVDVQSNENFSSEQVLKAFIRSDDVLLGNGSENCIEGNIEQIIPYGFQYKLVINVGFSISLLISKHRYIELNPRIGGKLLINIKPNNIHLVS